MLVNNNNNNKDIHLLRTASGSKKIILSKTDQV